MLHDDDMVIRRTILNAEEVAQSIVANGSLEIDYNAWPTLSDTDKVEAFDELVALLANQSRHEALTYPENCVEWLSEIKDSLLETFKHWAEREIRTKSTNGLEKDE